MSNKEILKRVNESDRKGEVQRKIILNKLKECLDILADILTDLLPPMPEEMEIVEDCPPVGIDD